jgi:hypothetical protein
MVLFAATMDEREDSRFFWVVVFALLLLTRIPVMSTYLSIDNVNLALSLENFDPRIHQPQPPGYPFYDYLGRVVNLLFHNAERTFAAISILVSGLCLPAAYLLGKRMFSRWTGNAAALLFLVNPVVWHSNLDGPLRPFLALFSLLTAYCCWRTWSGEKSFVIWGAAALGIGSGFRPDLLAFLFPLWLVSGWAGTKSWKAVVQGFAVLTAVALVWVGALVASMGGVQTFIKIMLDYAVDQSKPESVVLGSSLMAWLRQMNRLVIWNGLAIVTWLWVLPFCFRYRDRVPFGGTHAAFFFMWLAPGLIVQALVHIGAPGHTLFSVAALCVLGGYVLSLSSARQAFLSVALVLNVMLFLDFFSLPAGAVNTVDHLPSVKNAVLFGTFETSIGQVRWLDEVTNTTLAEIDQFTPKDGPSIIISTNTYVSQWFMNWRIGRYYLPSRELWVLYNDAGRKRVEHIRRDVLLDMRDSAPLRVPVFRQGRILWLIEPNSQVHQQISATQKLSGGRYVFYSEITPDTPPFMIGDFEIVPALFGFVPPQARSIQHP